MTLGLTQVRLDALGGILSVAAPRLAALVNERGSRDADGSFSLRLPSAEGTYTLTNGMAAGANNTAHPALDVRGPYEGQDSGQLFQAHFLHDEVAGTWCVGTATTNMELAILSALDSLSSHLPEWDGTFFADPSRRLGLEHAMVRQDGGFPGATCREHLDTLRNEVVRGLMLNVANALPDLASLHEKLGYRWGERYLAYGDADRHGCMLPAKDAIACFHDNIDLFDDNASWVVGMSRTRGGSDLVSIWAFDRRVDDPVKLIGQMLPGNLDRLGDPHVSIDMSTESVVVRPGFDPGSLVDNAFFALFDETEVLRSLSSDPGSVKTEGKTDFSIFTPEDLCDEDDEDEDVPLGPRI